MGHMNKTDTGLKLTVAHSSLQDSRAATDECARMLALEPSDAPTWLFVGYSAPHDAGIIGERLHELFPAAHIAGISSCLGVMTTAGIHGGKEFGMGIFALQDPAGDFGVGVVKQGDDPRLDAAAALKAALDDAGCPGQCPSLVWLSTAPGYEEEILKGIADVVGPEVPVAGGSSPDGEIPDFRSQIAGSEGHKNAIVISALFPSVDLSLAFHSGYDRGDYTGRVTRASGRLLQEIDGEPAAVVYNRWSGGLIAQQLKNGGCVIEETPLTPLGRDFAEVGGAMFHKLTYVGAVTPEGALTLYTTVEEGEKVFIMTGSREKIIHRAGRTIQAAIDACDFEREDIRGALVTFCAGCRMNIQEDVAMVAEEIDKTLGGAPFLGVFTYGEQGCFLDQENSHGNLMISVALFLDNSIT